MLLVLRCIVNFCSRGLRCILLLFSLKRTQHKIYNTDDNITYILAKPKRFVLIPRCPIHPIIYLSAVLAKTRTI